MQTGDGLLVRLNPHSGGFSCKSLIGLCESASRHGNGIVEVTARGSLQIRGLTPSSVKGLARDVEMLGIAVRNGVPVEAGPLAGLDPTEIRDPRGLAEAIGEAIGRAGLVSRLGPKVSVIVDGGGRIRLDDIPADVRLTARRDGEAVAWRLALGGTQATARLWGIVGEADACAATVAVLEAIAALGSTGRAKDLPCPARSGGDLSDMAQDRACFPLGLLPLANSAQALAIALPFGSMPAGRLIALAEEAGELGATEVRPAPARALLLLGLSAHACRHLQQAAAGLGFVTEPDDARLSIAACPGAPACASGRMATRTLAERFARENGDILDGTFMLHVSGCAKGCAHPGPAALTLAGGEGNVGLIMHGSANMEPASRRSAATIGRGLDHVATRLRAARRPNETTAACIARIGETDIATAFGTE
jgi:precorrin-3B synthase